MSLLWDVVEREEPILLRNLLGKIEVYVTGTVKLECKNKEGESVVLNLYNTLYIPHTLHSILHSTLSSQCLPFHSSEDEGGTLHNCAAAAYWNGLDTE